MKTKIKQIRDLSTQKEPRTGQTLVKVIEQSLCHYRALCSKELNFLRHHLLIYGLSI